MGLISRVSSRTYRFYSKKSKKIQKSKNGPKSLYNRPITKKRNRKFIRHHSQRYDRVPSGWRKPRGIDSALRRRFSGMMTMPSIGFGTNAKTRHCCRDQLGFKRFLVHNVEELNCLMMSNRKFAAEIAKGVSSKKRKVIVERAQALNVHVTNASKLRSEENE